jgi:hypothetical protein
VTVSECLEVISNLKLTSFGLNTLPAKLLLHVKDVLAVPLTQLINNSFQAGIFPSCLKCATVTPIFKTGDASNASNYRPISVLPLFSKIFERCMCTRLVDFAKKFTLISPKQYGFQKDKSTVDALVDLTEFIYAALNNKEHCLSVFVDLRKAFDTVNHTILLQKIHHYGVRGLPLKWFDDYLRERRQRVRVGKSLSDTKFVNIGVPQGSILGPILFLIFINDLPQMSSMFSTILFADDTTLSSTNVSYENLITRTNRELEKFKMWSVNNRLSVNIGKTFAILFTNRLGDINYDSKVYFDGGEVLLKNCGNFLGVCIDDGLKFHNHIFNVCSKLSKQIGILYRLRPYVPQDVMQKLYYSLVYPYLIYCNLVWGGTHGAHLSPLVVLQKKIVRIITGEGYLAHTDPLFFRTGILKLADIHTYILGLYAHKAISVGSFHLSEHQYFTRNRYDPVPPFQRLTLSQRAVSYAAPRTWNSLPQTIRDCASFGTFKINLKKHFIESYAYDIHV